MNNVTTHIAASIGRLRLVAGFDPKEVGQRIARARKRKGWTQVEFALELHVSPSSVSRWERGMLPPVHELLRIGDLLGIDMGEFLDQPLDVSASQALIVEELSRMRALLEEVLEELRRQGPNPLHRENAA